MVLLKWKRDPDDVQATIKVTFSASPTISLSDPAAELCLPIELRIVSSKREGQPITFMVDNTVFEVYDASEGGMDMFSRGAFGGLSTTSDDRSKSISLGLFRINNSSRSDSADLRERGYRFVTIPGDGSPVAITHRLDWARIFKYEEKRSKDDLRPGEGFRIGLGSGYLGTMWWCWGDLETDLKHKKLHVWHPAPFADPKPDDAFVRQGDWVLGEEPMHLDWQYDAENGRAQFEVVP